MPLPVDPLVIKAIDPIPRISDPYWDIARLLNAYELMEAVGRKYPDNQQFAQTYQLERRFIEKFIEKYLALTDEAFDPKRLLANQIVSWMATLQRREKSQAQTEAVGNTLIPLDKKTGLALGKHLLAQHISTFIQEEVSQPSSSQP